MFKNYKAEMKLVKQTRKERKVQTAETIIEVPVTPDYVTIVRQTGRDIVKGAAVLIGVYVGADTLRQVAVQIADNLTKPETN